MSNSIKYFFVGAIHDNHDTTAEYLEQGKWELGWFDAEEEQQPQYQKMLSKYNQMKAGDKIVIKSTYTRKNDLPFHVEGHQTVAVMMLKAYGTITANVGDGHTILVDWDKSFEPREWYFFTGRETIWIASDSNYDSSAKLIDFVNGAKQEYDWFLSQPTWSKYVDKGQDNVNFLDYDELEKLLTFFVHTAQLKILTKVDPTATLASSFYHEGDNRYNTLNNTLGLQRDDWKNNISAYSDVNEDWFQEGLECIHFMNGSAQNRNYAWRNASIHLSLDHKYAIEFMFGMDGVKGDNLIHSLDARLFNLYDETGSHTTNKNSYTSTKGNQVLFSIPVSLSLDDSGKINDTHIDLNQDVYDMTFNYLSKTSVYFSDSDMTDLKGAIMETTFINRYSKTLLNSNNVIFRGAPGTGKSYLAKSIAADIISGGTTDKYDNLTKAQKEQIEFVQFHPSYDYTDFVEGLRPKTNADGTIGFVLEPGVFKRFVSKARQNYIDAHKDIEVLSKEKSAQRMIDDFLGNLDLEENQFSTVRGSVFNIIDFDDERIEIAIPDNVIVKTLTLKLSEIRSMIESTVEFSQVKDVTSFFGMTHGRQQYSYHLSLFKEIHTNHTIDSDIDYEREVEKPYIFIIDEINRGEISKIFGELFFSIDPGYRGTSGEVATQYDNLHHPDEAKFYVPNNVYIIGTMNDIDRSVDSFDFAMRRRFRFINIKADENIAMLDNLANKDEAKQRMMSLNKAISNVSDLNENYHIGASYFLKLSDVDFDSLWDDYLAPLLHDYVRGLYNEMELLADFKKAYDSVDEPDDH